MEKEWKSPKTIIGPAATGDFYFSRTNIENDIWDELKKGTSVLLAAPRRVGKTSIMRAIEENPQEGFLLKFEIIQGVQTKEDFYKTIFKLLYSCLSRFKKTTTYFEHLLKSIKITEIDISGSISIDGKPINYLEETSKILTELNSSNEKIVLLIDELPEVLHNINKNGKKEDASEILDNLRVWRQKDYKNIQFVLAGSIGIHYVVSSIEGRTKDLNDLHTINCEPLSKKEAKAYINWATDEATIQYNDEQTELLLEKTQHYYTPYFLNLMLDRINNNAKRAEKKTIDASDIHNAFNQNVKENSNFEDWKRRLIDYMPTEKFNFVNEILIYIAHKGQITIQKIYDIAVKYEMLRDYMTLIRELEKDGYIVEETPESKSYRFISPFLKSFWYNDNPIFND